ncbi:MAG TPA: Gfo/Idh/MocA family oxidoreductase [Erysipelotrichaceae bacterium]|jgi:predicted dehydrogenase|nr:Gfo/Idh/MocA family oxidoreductase [Erysipelotrichaceae bacterium]HQB32143.1 Gfo/Idh/MocA family oxidoreductase [Erysipelotrichaceae bacterium]
MRIGIVGTNFVCDMFMEGVSYVRQIEITAVCSGQYGNAVKFAEKYGIENIFKDYIEMMESGTVDAIYLATPNSKHHEMTLECLKRKFPVFCEKPLACNYRQVREMIETAKEHDVHLHDGTVPLYSPNLRILKEYLPKIGQIRKAVFIFSKYSSRYDAYLRKENPTTFRKELCNGSIMDLGIYAIADAVALFGKPDRIYASAQFLDNGVDCGGTAVFHYGDFEVVILHSKVTDTQIISEIQGEKGNLYLPRVSRLDKIYYQSREENRNMLYNENNGMISIGKDYDHQFANQLRDFLYCYKNGLVESEVNPFSQILDIHEVLTQCRLQSEVIFDCDERVKYEK